MNSEPASATNSDNQQPGTEIRDVSSWDDAIRIAGAGFAMGSADVVPGVSGGTMAVACGIYDRLLTAIASINPKSIGALLKFKIAEMLRLVHWRFLVALFAGVFSAVVVMVKIVGLPKLLISQPTLVYSVFFGLVFASVFVLGKTISWTPARAGWLILGALFGWLVVTQVPVNTPGGPAFMFAYGSVAISAMLLPGISGSFILLILGQYQRVIGALESLIHLDFSALMIVVPFAVGCLFGLMAFSRVFAWMLRRYHDPVVAALCGLLIGSLWRIWPYQNTKTIIVREKPRVIEATPFFPEQIELFPILLVLAGFGGVFLVEFLAKMRKAGDTDKATSAA